LAPFPPEEQKQLEELMPQILDAVQAWLRAEPTGVEPEPTDRGM
jgi:hypothetical protein